MIVADAQVHLFDTRIDDTGDRAPLKQLEGNPSTEKIDFLDSEGLLPLLDGAGVTRAALVPPTQEGGRNETALAIAARLPDRLGVMGVLPLERTPSTALRGWLEQPGMLGVRLNFGGTVSRGSLLEEGFAWIWQSASDEQIPMMVFAPGQTADFGELARRYPSLRLIVDHLNLGRDAKNIGLDAALRPLYGLADAGNLAVKISALPCYVDEGPPFGSLDPHIDRVISSFGAERCMWGSDVTRLPCAYLDWVTAMRNAISQRSETEQTAVLGGSLSSWLNWPDTAS